MGWDLGLLLMGFAYTILYFLFALLAVTLYNRYLFRKRFPQLAGSFRGLARFGLAVLMAFTAGIMAVFSGLVMIYDEQTSHPFDNSGLGDYYQVPLVYPYVLFTIDEPIDQSGSIGPYDDINRGELHELGIVSQIGVEQYYIIGWGKPYGNKIVGEYFMFDTFLQTLDLFATKEELELAWQSRTEFPMPLLRTPGEYNTHFWQEYYPHISVSRRLIGPPVVLILLSSFTLAPMLWIYLAHITYRRKNRKLQVVPDKQISNMKQRETSGLEKSNTNL
jgi:hypothetical protein